VGEQGDLPPHCAGGLMESWWEYIYIYIKLIPVVVSQTPCVVARSSASLHRLHFLRTNLTFLPTAFLQPFSFSLSACATVCLEVREKRAGRKP